MKHEIFFNKPAATWNEALPIGNGILGAMVYGGIDHEIIQVNEDSLWSSGPRNRVNPDAKYGVKKVQELLLKGDSKKAHRLAAQTLFSTAPDCSHYETLGEVHIMFRDNYEGKLSDPLAREDVVPYRYSRKLDIDNAVGSISFDREVGCGREHDERHFFASEPDHVIVYEIQNDNREMSFEVTCDRNSQVNHWLINYENNGAIDNRTIALSGNTGGQTGINYVMMVRVEIDDGSCNVIGRRIVVKHASNAKIFITGRTTFRSDNPIQWCIDTLDQIVGLSGEKLVDRHVADYCQYYDRTDIVLGNTDDSLSHLTTEERLLRLKKGGSDLSLIETYCDYAKYLFISSSRPGSLPSNLQGIWCKDFDSAWGSKYTLNINVQMNYWFAEAMGLSDLDMPLLEHIRRMLPSGEYVANKMYGVKGFVCHHNTDIWGDCAPVDDALTSSIWPMGAAWLCLHVIDHYRYTQDSAYLQRYAPIVQEATRFLINISLKNNDNHWVIGPSVSPENKYRLHNGMVGSLCIGSAIDEQIMKELFIGYLYFVESLKFLGINDVIDESLAETASVRIKELQPIAIDSHGFIMEWDQEYEEADPGHRHFSPLFGVYPGSSIRPDKTPDLAKAALRTLNHRISCGSSRQNSAGKTGWSRAWSSILFSRLDKSEQAWDGLVKLVGTCAFNNLCNADDLSYSNTPFQIDGNFGGLTALLEMVIRDYGDEIILLPSLPAALSKGNLCGITCKSGCTLDMVWENRQLKSLCLHGLRKGEVILRIKSEKKCISFQKNETIHALSVTQEGQLLATDKGIG